MIPVHQLLALAGFEPIVLTVERSTPNPAAINEYGDPVRPDVTLLQIEFVYHQTSRKTVAREELDEGRDWRSFYCRERLQVGDQTPDVIRADGGPEGRL